MANIPLTQLKEQLIKMLAIRDPEDIASLYRAADAIRRRNMGDAVFLRGIIEFSNVCANHCLYCGLRAPNTKVRRYVMTAAEIMDTAHRIEEYGQTTVVLQSGKTAAFGDRELGELIRRIKSETNLAVTLSVGNRPRDIYAYWHECGMDRYLLRFETSDPAMFTRLHPDCQLEERLRCLHDLRTLGVQVGSGFMIGLPGETRSILADNILLCRQLNLDMIGIGPFIPHPDTPLDDMPNVHRNDPEMFFTTLAVLRICNPRAHIPATTAYDAVFPGEGRNLALQRGANIFMPNSTPAGYRGDYLLYPGKPCVDEDGQACAKCVLHRLENLGRTPGIGPGHSIKTRKAMVRDQT